MFPLLTYIGAQFKTVRRVEGRNHESGRIGKMLKTGDQVRYISDVYKEYQGQVMTAVEFDIHHRLMWLCGEDGGEIPAFWDEIEVV